jgi:hypothetical protein
MPAGHVDTEEPVGGHLLIAGNMDGAVDIGRTFG